MLFWKLIDINSRFMDFAVKDEQILEIVGSLLHQSLNFAKETGTFDEFNASPPSHTM